jgi:hypothetical protein
MRNKIGFAILTFLPLFTATVESRACIGHFLQEPWPAHEMFHLLMGLSGLLATYVLILILVWIPLRSGQRWAWFAIAAAALIVHGGQLASDVVTDGGLRNHTAILGSGSLVFAGIIATLLLYGVGLALTWPSSSHRAAGPRP